VVDLGENGAALFSASVTFDENGPFDHMNGPDRVSSHEAVAWARRHAERITVRLGDVLYTAGEVPIAGLPDWAEEVRADPRAMEVSLTAWTATGTTAIAGHDFDVCSMSVNADPPSTTL
jgi:hypothetical protein